MTERLNEKYIKKYLPSEGEGDTKATQIATAVNNLDYMWQNNADVYDNTHQLAQGDNDISCYANWLYKHTTAEIKSILDKVVYAEDEDDYDEEYDEDF